MPMLVYLVCDERKELERREIEKKTQTGLGDWRRLTYNGEVRVHPRSMSPPAYEKPDNEDPSRNTWAGGSHLLLLSYV